MTSILFPGGLLVLAVVVSACALVLGDFDKGPAAGTGGVGNTGGGASSSSGTGAASSTTAGAGGAGSSSSSGAGGSGGSGGGGGGVVLTPSATGNVRGNAAGVVGAWYVYSDGFGADGNSSSSDCVSKGMFPVGDCSVVTSPAPGGPFPPNAAGAMCLAGVAAQVIGNVDNPMGDFADLFGEGIGLALDDPADGAPGFYNASAFTGISFDIDNAQANLRVQFPTRETVASGSSAYWGSSVTSPGSPVVAGTNVIHWADVGGPAYATNPPAFDVTMIQAIQFSVYTTIGSATPVSFCISNLTLLTN